ncbi:AEC family transporter [Arcobacter sp.]|uniref:AEC family transporter n=1 Tax=Arcobacter sp. TaxID=1872629 RepID=UPI003C730537
MTLLITILLKILPIYLNVILGYLSSKFLNIKRESIATLLIYILGPIVVFSASLSVKINLAVAFLPIFLFVFSSIIALVSLKIFQNSWPNTTGNILSFSIGTGNTGYFGVPMAIIFFPPSVADIYIFTVLASNLYETTTGFYVTAKGNFTLSQVIRKMSKLPVLYAFIFGIFFNLYGVEIPHEISSYTGQFKGAFGILGMMMLGMGLVGLKGDPENFDFKFISITFIVKFIFWPLVTIALIYIDKTYFNFLNKDLYNVLFLFAIVPLAGNAVTFAVLLNTKPEKVSFAVLLSTLLSVITIPLYIYLYGGF